MTARIVAQYRHGGAAQEALHWRQVDFLPLNMARRGSVGENIAVRGDNVELNARIKGHQPAKQRFQRAAVDPALRVQNRFALNDLLRQPAR